MQPTQTEVLHEPCVLNRERQLYDDTTTWLAEMLEGNMHVPFEFRFNGRELYGEDGSALERVFSDSLKAADALPAELWFEKRRRATELDEYHEMLEMMRGTYFNTMIVLSDFPAELAGTDKDVGGYNTMRKQTMLRVLTKTSDDTLKIKSQSLDGSDRTALEAIYAHFGHEPMPGELLGQRIHLQLDEEEQEFMTDELRGVYDRSLENQFGGSWYAGRQSSLRMNTYDFVRTQTDLLDMYFESAQNFGDNPRFLHDIAAALQKRYLALGPDRGDENSQYQTFTNPELTSDLLQEVLVAGDELRQSGKTLSGCGLTLGDDKTTIESQLSKLGFGNKSGEDKYGSLTFKCPKGHSNRRPRNKLIPHCTTCGVSVKC